MLAMGKELRRHVDERTCQQVLRAKHLLTMSVFCLIQRRARLCIVLLRFAMPCYAMLSFAILLTVCACVGVRLARSGGYTLSCTIAL